MRSTESPTVHTAQSAGDLTTKARIRDAALARFPAEGFAATTIRSIADDAGVSAGLVVHHFGSKDGLREACDQYVVSKFRETKMAAMEDDNVDNPGFASATFDIAPHLARYFSWALTRGHEAADELFDEMIREGLEVTRVAVDKGMVKDSSDLPTRTTLHMAMMLGMLSFHAHIERITGIDALTPEGMARLTPAILEIFSGLFEEEYLAAFSRAYAEGADEVINRTN